MAILRFNDGEKVEVVFREGTRGEKSTSQKTGEVETRHFVNQEKGGSDTIFLPDEAQSLLEKLRPRNDETVVIWKEKLGRAWEWHVQLKDARPQNLLDQPSNAHALNYPQQQLARPEANVLLMAYMAAFDAQMGVIEYGKNKGVSIAFSAVSLTTDAHCIYIEACKQRADGRRAA